MVRPTASGGTGEKAGGIPSPFSTTPPPSLRPGARLGPYEVQQPIGSGGMGEVYRARDSRLGRWVALKVLAPSVASRSEALARFEREARAVAALSHPNVLAVFDVGHEGRTTFLVTELLEGETLRARLDRGPLPPRKAVEIAIQAALGLSAAHEKGIVHRDLKPENVFVTRDGQVKLLDFGLSRGLEVAAAAAAEADADPGLTDPDRVVGTPAYMSPEQVTGGTVDHRSDVFAFGALLYEMLAGRRAFRGATSVETMTAVARKEPLELATLRTDVPPVLERIVRRCLEKSPDERFQSARDLAFALGTAVDPVSRSAPGLPGTRPAPRWPRALAAAALLVGGLAAGAWVAVLLREPYSPPAIRPLTASGGEAEAAVSPDRRLLAFTSHRDGRGRVWIKQLAGGAETPLTEGPDDHSPRFSPDGASLLWVRGASPHATLLRGAAVGGEPTRIVEDAAFADWAPSGDSIYFLRQLGDSFPLPYALFRVSPDGSGIRELAHFSDELLSAPRVSPDSRTVAILSIPATANRGSTYLLVSTDGSRIRRLHPPAGIGLLKPGAWTHRGRSLVYAQASSVRYGGARLFRQEVGSGRVTAILTTPFELGTLDLLGGGRAVADAVTMRAGFSEARIGSTSALGLARVSGSGVDRQPVYTPDGKSIVFSSNRTGDLELWSLALSTGALRRLTEHPADDWDPGVAPDGSLVWSSGRTGNLEIFVAAPDGSAPRQVTRDGTGAENPTATADGWIVYRSGDRKQGGVWKIRRDGTDGRRLVPNPIYCPDVSPDGRWVAFVVPAFREGETALVRVVSIEDGSPTAFAAAVRPVHPTGLILGRPRWRADGKAVAFVGLDAGGRAGVHVQDFDPVRDTSATRRELKGVTSGPELETFALSPDGERVALGWYEARSDLVALEGLPGLGEGRDAGR